MPQSCQATNQGARLRFASYVLDEAAIDLEGVNLEIAQVIQARVAGAKIIQGNTHAFLAQHPEHFLRAAQILNEGGLGQLDFEAPRRQPRFLENRAVRGQPNRTASIETEPPSIPSTGKLTGSPGKLAPRTYSSGR